MRTWPCWCFAFFLSACDTAVAPAPHDPLPDSFSPPVATFEPGELPAPDTVAADRSIYESYLPATVAQFIEAKIPGWELPHPNEWEAYGFTKHKTDSTLVNVAPLDVDCDRQTDYAVLLYHAESKRTGLWIIRHDAGAYVADSVDSFVNNPGNYGIAVIRDSQARDMYEDEPVVIACDAIDFIKFESASRAYYFTGKAYKYVQTSD